MEWVSFQHPATMGSCVKYLNVRNCEMSSSRQKLINPAIEKILQNRNFSFYLSNGTGQVTEGA